MKNESKNNVNLGWKIALAAVVLFLVIAVGGIVLLPMLQTVGGSFGYGYPSAKGGRAVRDVEIDVEPQVVYRIDDHRFFTLEKYLDCNSGGFVYYNDTNKKVRFFTGLDSADKKPQNEISIGYKNNAMAFKGRFIYAASDDVVAYPWRNIDYKYGGADYFVIYKNMGGVMKTVSSGSLLSSATVTVTNEAMYIQDGAKDKLQKIIKTSVESKVRDEWVDSSSIILRATSRDDHFHCDENIRPRSVKYIE